MQLMDRSFIAVVVKRTFVPTLCALAATIGLLAQMRPQSQSGSGAPSIGQGIVFLVRHAERTDAKVGGDPGLSEAGRTRAISLATLLKDAGITAIFTTELRRARETAAPLANSLGITPVTVGADDLKGLIPRLRRTAGNALVVGHSNTLPDLISDLGVPSVYISDSEYDNLFIVMPVTTNGVPRLIRLHYR